LSKGLIKKTASLNDHKQAGSYCCFCNAAGSVPAIQPPPVIGRLQGEIKTAKADDPRCIEPVRIDRDMFERQWWGDK